MTLLDWQRAFRAEIAASDEQGAPSSLGMAIYRDAYRGRLLAALASAFERTRAWVGEQAFDRAAAHYILTTPPTGWTLDAYGARFPDLLADLFAQNPEAAELAWFEWHLQQAFAAPDRPCLGAADLAQAALDPESWQVLRLYPAAGHASRRVQTGCLALWRALGQGDGTETDLTAPADPWLTVWRRDEQPHFRLLADDEHALLAALIAGRPLGEALAAAGAEAGDQAQARPGGWLAQWLDEGQFSGFALPQDDQTPLATTRRSALA